MNSDLAREVQRKAVTILCEGRTDVGSCSHYVIEEGTGTTWDEVLNDARNRMRARGFNPSGEIMAIGGNNYRADWEALSGPQPANYRFRDDDEREARGESRPLLRFDDVH